MSRGAAAPVLGLLVAVLGVGTGQANTIQVNSLADTAASGDGLCTLREAIVAANTNTASGGVAGECAAGQAAPTRDAIVFGVAGMIQPASPLPAVTELALVSGIGHIGSPGAPCPSILPVPTIELDGANAGGAGLQITGGGSVVRGLAINRFPGSGILLTGPGGNRVQCNFIGTDPTGALPLGNGGRGVDVVGSDNLVGTDGDGTNDANEGNLISGNGDGGVFLRQLGTDRNRVSGNRIGTDTTGTTAIPNALGGVIVSTDASDNIVGTNGDGVGDAGVGNLISGNAGAGVFLSDASQQTRLSGNRIGTSADGSAALPNASYGVWLAFSSGNVVGTNGDGVADAFEGNLISGNSWNGLLLEGIGTQQNRVSGNRIGTNVDGTAAIPNEEGGLILDLGASGNFVGTNGDGTADALEGNLISGNGWDGILLGGYETVQNRVSGNRIGTNADGDAAIPNQGAGIELTGEAHNNFVGTNGDGVGDAAEGNLVSGNLLDGVRLAGSTGPIPSPPYQNRVSGNWIGTTADGNGPLPNQKMGVFVGLSAHHNTIGTDSDGIADAGERNVIAFNSLGGIAVVDGATLGDTLANRISRNSSFSNVLLGIDLGGNGVTGNDPGDGDSGPNGLQNFPEIQSATLGGGGLEIVYSVPAPTPLAIEFFLADSAGEEGEIFLGGATYAAAGSATANLPAGPAAPGDLVVATATDVNGNTSEFSGAVTLAAGTSNAIFGDGFESGDALAWDACVGCGP